MANPRLSKLAGDYGGDLLLPVATLASGGSKIAASMQLVGGVIVTKVLGPLGAVAGVMAGILVSLVKWEQTAQLVAKAMDKATAKDAMIKQFAELTKSVATAKAKIQDLFQFAQKAPFNFESIMEGGRRLAEVSKGLLVTKGFLTIVGDSAAASGQKFNTVADSVATLYENLKNGQPVKESAEALRDMGVISQSVVEKVASLQQSGAGLTVTMDTITEALKANKGAMAGVVETVEQLTSKQTQIKAGIITPAGQIFNDSQQKGLQAQNALLERLAPTLTVTARAGARVSSVLGYLQNGILNLIAKIPFLGAMLGTLITGFTVLSASVLGLSTIKLSAWLIEVLASLARYTAATSSAAAATAALQLAQSRIATGRAQLTMAAGEGLVAAGFAQGPALPASMAGLAGASAAAGAKNIAMGGAARIAAMGVNLLKEGVAYLAKGLMFLVATPLGLTVTALTAVGTALVYAGDRYSAATEAITEMGEASNDTNKAMNQQIANIRDAADAANAYKTALDNQSAAEAKLAEVQAERSHIPLVGGLLNLLNQQDTKELAAKNAMGDAKVSQKKISNIEKSGQLANSPDFNEKDVQNTIATDRARREEELAQANPYRRVEILKSRAEASRNEAGFKEDTQKSIAGVTNPQMVAALLATSGSREMREQGQLQGAKTPLEKQQAENKIARTKGLLGNPAGDQEAYIAANAAFAITEKREELEGKIVDQQRDVLLLDKEATQAAKDKVGTLQAQIDLIKNNKDLSDQAKANAIEQLKITQLQAAAEIYRNKIALDADTKRTGAQVAMMRGQMAYSRSLENQAALEEADAKEKKRTDEETAKNMESGKFDTIEEARAAAAATAQQERKNDALSSFLEKQKQIASMTTLTAVGPITPNTENIFSKEEAEAGRAAGFGVSDNQVQREAGEGGPGSPFYKDQAGGASPLDEPLGANHKSIGDLSATMSDMGPAKGGRHFGMDSILGAVNKPTQAHDPILTEAQKQTNWLEKIAINTANLGNKSSTKKAL